MLILIGVIWPAAQFTFLQSQFDLTKNVSNPLYEIYFPTMLIQLATLLLILVAVRSEGSQLFSVGMTKFNRWTILQAAIFFVAANALLSLVQLAVALESPKSFAEIATLLPRTSFERVIWVIMCVIVAFCEEMTFRGYLITRISHFAKGRIWLGVLIATVSFASGHLYQGFGGFFLIFIYGLMFAGLYVYTGSLYPCIIAHFLQDVSVLFIPGLK